MRVNIDKRWLLALLLSVLVHGLLVKGLSSWPVWQPIWDEAPMAVSLVAAEPPLAPAAPKLPYPAKSPKLQVPPKSLPRTVDPAPVPEPQNPAVADAPQPDALIPVSSIVPSEAMNDLAMNETQPPALSTIETVAYQFPEESETADPPRQVVMDFALQRKGGLVATERQAYVVESDGRYRLQSVVKAKGLLALALSDLMQSSEGELTSNGLRPTHYRYQYGHNKAKSREAAFDWASRQLTMTSGERKRSAELPDGAQDLMSFMYQFMFVPPLLQMQLAITNGKRLKVYDYAFEGEETLATAVGNLRCLRIGHAGNDGQEKTELWLAADYHYLPVKIRDIDEDGIVTERIVTNLKMETTPHVE